MIVLTREQFGTFEAATSREWLVTNGLGGFAAGTIAGANTRRYHGLLFASLRPPLERTLMVAKLDLSAKVGAASYALATNEFADGTVAPAGYEHLESFRLEGAIPVWRYRLADTVLEQRIWMAHGENTTYVQFRLLSARHPIALELVPLCTYRDYHWQLRGSRSIGVKEVEHGIEIDPGAGLRRYRIVSDRGSHRIAPDWYWNFRHRAESERGLDDLEDLFRPGIFTLTLAPGEHAAIVLTAESHEPMEAHASLQRERERQCELLESPLLDKSSFAPPRGVPVGHQRFVLSDAIPMDPRFRGDDGHRGGDDECGSSDDGYRRRDDECRDGGDEHRGVENEYGRCVQATAVDTGLRSVPTWVTQLVLAADQFIVERRDSSGTFLGATVIAGYPWFSDWGRDTMISLPGLTLSTGRFDVAASILRTFARFVSEGMLPNRFPDAGEAPEYNTVDATLWYFVAIDEYVRRSCDRKLVADLFPILQSIVDWHRRGTRFGICVDPADGLLRAGAAGTQLTWMDVKIGDWVVTPRIGKPVEINALWFNVLTIMRDFATMLDDTARAHDYAAAAARVRSAFDRFWFDAGGYLFDVIDAPGGDDASLRPNQLFALSLRHALLDGQRARQMVDRCARELWTPIGLRSLACGPHYEGRYTGAAHQRDAVYHQGTAWSWLLGPLARAHYRAYGDAARALSFLEGTSAHLRDACIGQVSEISDGDAPFAPRGCFAQAWGVAEILFAWSEINASEASGRDCGKKRVGRRAIGGRG